MRSYEELGTKLKEIIGKDNRVKFQPGPSINLTYPCILYQFEGVYNTKANDKSYIVIGKYSVTHIYKDISNSLVEPMLSSFDHISYENRQIVDGLYHDYYTIYY